MLGVHHASALYFLDIFTALILAVLATSTLYLWRVPGKYLMFNHFLYVESFMFYITSDLTSDFD